MKRLLIIPMSLVEVIALSIAWLLVFIHKPTARKWANYWMKILPDGEWYSSK